MRILVAEDEPDLLASLAQALREEDYAVDTASDGEDALYKALEHEYDVIVLDVMMPGKNGWDVLAGLRGKRSTPVLFLTARDTLRDRVRGLDGGADDYLTKPFELDELLARLRVLARRGPGRPATAVFAGEVRVDVGRRWVEREGRPVALTPREYRLVEYLVLNRGRVVSRTELYEHLFDEEDNTLSNLLDVHVSNVRKKLGAEFVQTRRGHGYCVE